MHPPPECRDDELRLHFTAIGESGNGEEPRGNYPRLLPGDHWGIARGIQGFHHRGRLDLGFDPLLRVRLLACFLLPFHFGVAKAFMDADVKFETATASSGGVMAALAILGGADIDVGIRQCFDLRLEPAAMPWSFKSFFDMYRQYFRIFRSEEYQRRVPLASLCDRLYVRLGTWTGNFQGDKSDKGVVQEKGYFVNKPWRVFQTTDFLSEKDLEDAFMSAAYVPGVTAVEPPMWRGTVALDAAMVDLLQGQHSKGFRLDNPSLWPPAKGNASTPRSNSSCSSHSASSSSSSSPRECSATSVDFAARSSSSNTTVMDLEEERTVKPTRIMVSIRPEDFGEFATEELVPVAGAYGAVTDFFASVARMRQGFIDGYQLAASTIDASSMRPEERERLRSRAASAGEILDAILQEHADWKSAKGFESP